MNQEQNTDLLLNFFKALADANRLKIIGLLAKEALSVEQLAEILNLHSSTVSHHLAKLSDAGLVNSRVDGYYNIYELNSKKLEFMAQQLLSKESLPAIAGDVDIDAYDRKVLNTYLDTDGKIKAFPTQRKKMEVILHYVAKSFEFGVRYSEKQVNEMLSQFNDDTARLRRNLIECGLMNRQGGGGEYWRTNE